MKWIDAAYTVLGDAAEPLHKIEIADRILARGLRKTRPKTPEDTIRRDIQQDIKRHGQTSRFIRVSSGVFTVRALDHASPDRPTPESLAGLTAAATRAAGSMSFADATERILRESRSREPLHYEEITRRAIEQGLIQPEGKTPAVSLNAIIGTDIRRRQERSESQRFVRPERGLIGMAEPLPVDLAAQITTHNQQVRDELLRRLRERPAGEFEDIAARLLEALGFQEVERTPLSRDGGIDVHGALVVGNVVIRMAVQAKRWDKNVQRPDVQRLRGSLSKRGLGQGLIITTSDFSNGAREEAADASPPVALMNGEELVSLLAEYEVGVERERHSLFKLIEV